ncbi:BRISC and BRCA1-A complex member 1-like [Schistocerca piceifrons]|uniref:BRISC and BRCA1-A complex member 1-like n=1 Tax=Schistocerca piceifrons TaxID=274613 RepID=UPI001F5F5F3A|nr:BRISC and BRCA1-A complex member 1-like [Schistocerca piceifrons]
MDGDHACGSENSSVSLVNNTSTSRGSSSDDSSPGPPCNEMNQLGRCVDDVNNGVTDDDCEILKFPAVSCPEKIVLCVDLAEDPDYTPFKLGQGSKFSPLYMVKRVTEIFLYSKNIISLEHEFALVVLKTDEAVWLSDFCSNPKEIISILEGLSETTQNETFNLTSLFDVIKRNVKLPAPHANNPELCPPYSVRVILLYSRSFCVPEFRQGRESFNVLTSSPYFTLDILYIHEQPSEDNKCEEAFSVLDGLDEQELSYVYDVLRNATKLHDHMAKLLAHPLQRPAQKRTHYKLKEPQDIPK